MLASRSYYYRKKEVKNITENLELPAQEPEESSLELTAICALIHAYMEKMGTKEWSEKLECKDGWYTVRASRVQGMGLHFSVTQEWQDCPFNSGCECCAQITDA